MSLQLNVRNHVYVFMASVVYVSKICRKIRKYMIFEESSATQKTWDFKRSVLWITEYSAQDDFSQTCRSLRDIMHNFSVYKFP